MRDMNSPHTANIDAAHISLRLVLLVVQQGPEPLGVFRVIQGEKIRLVLKVIEALQFGSWGAAAWLALSCRLLGLFRVHIDVDTLGRAQRLRDTRRSGGYGGRDGDGLFARSRLAGSWRRSRQTVISQLTALNRPGAC